jgi:hypothetical protein
MTSSPDPGVGQAGQAGQRNSTRRAGTSYRGFATILIDITTSRFFAPQSPFRRIITATAPIETNFSKRIKLSDGRAATLRFIDTSDRDKVLAFAKKLTEDDLL